MNGRACALHTEVLLPYVIKNMVKSLPETQKQLTIVSWEFCYYNLPSSLGEWELNIKELGDTLLLTPLAKVGLILGLCFQRTDFFFTGCFEQSVQSCFVKECDSLLFKDKAKLLPHFTLAAVFDMSSIRKCFWRDFGRVIEISSSEAKLRYFDEVKSFTSTQGTWW